jgi:hypothetical protein
MDLLDRVIDPATDLLSRVDAVLVRCGAPHDHPVWAEMSRARALPSEALTALAALAPTEMNVLADQLSQMATSLAGSTDAVPTDLGSQGVAAEGFATAWRGLSAQIAAGHAGSSVPGHPTPSQPPSELADRIAATAAQCAEIAQWASDARRELAGELGACLGSSEAVLIRAAQEPLGEPAMRAAADIAALVLGTASRAIERGWRCFDQWSGLDRPVPLAPIPPSGPQIPHHIELR